MSQLRPGSGGGGGDGLEKCYNSSGYISLQCYTLLIPAVQGSNIVIVWLRPVTWYSDLDLSYLRYLIHEISLQPSQGKELQ